MSSTLTRMPLSSVGTDSLPLMRSNWQGVNKRNIISLEASMETSCPSTAEKLTAKVPSLFARDCITRTNPVILSLGKDELKAHRRRFVDTDASRAGVIILTVGTGIIGGAFLVANRCANAAHLLFLACIGGPFVWLGYSELMAKKKLSAGIKVQDYIDKQYPDYDVLLKQGIGRRQWGRIVDQLLLTERMAPGEYARPDYLRERMDAHLRKNHAITLKEFRKGKVSLTGNDVAEIFAWRTGRHEPDEIARWAGEAWALRAMGRKNRLKLDYRNMAGAADFFNLFAETMTGVPVPSVGRAWLSSEVLGTEYTPSLIHLIRDIEYYAENDLPWAGAASLAYCVRYYIDTNQPENAQSMFEGLRAYLDGRYEDVQQHNRDVLERLSGDDFKTDEIDVLIALHERLVG